MPKEYEYEYENITIKVGENAQDNWDLLKSSNQNWWWFHLDKFSSSYVIVCDNLKKNKHINNVCKYAAELCKQHSKYKNLNRVSVIYTQVKNVKRGTQIGEAIVKKSKKIVV